MIPGIEEYYQIIAEEVMEVLPYRWEYAKVEAVFHYMAYRFEGVCRGRTLGIRGFYVPEEAQAALIDLRELFRKAGKPVWGQVEFEFYPDGAFNVKWGYENCDADGNTIIVEEDEEAEEEVGEE